MAKAKKATKKAAIKRSTVKETTKRAAKEARDTSKQHPKSTMIGVTAAVAAAAGAYFLLGSKKAPQNRQKVKSWMLRARADVLKKLEDWEVVSKEQYDAMIESVGRRYDKMKDSTKAEVKDFVREMKGHWPDIEESAKGTMKTAGKAAAKAAAVDVAQKVQRRAVDETEDRSTEQQ